MNKENKISVFLFKILSWVWVLSTLQFIWYFVFQALDKFIQIGFFLNIIQIFVMWLVLLPISIPLSLHLYKALNYY
ncbi:MAG: hypothetical protein RR636_07275, partial [Clostridium sp.]